MTNVEIAAVLKEMSLYYEMDSVPWKPAAYRRASEAIASADYQMTFRYAKGGLKGLEEAPGVGPAIGAHIEMLLRGRVFPELKAYRKKYPVHLLELTSVEGVGPKTVKLLYEKLRVRDLEDLERAARAGKLHSVRGFGARSEKNILEAVARLRRVVGRHFLGDVLPMARGFETAMRAVPGVVHAVVAGSVRRMQETIGDIDLLVTTSSPTTAIAAFIALPEVARIMESGPTKVTVELKNGMQADLRVIEDASFGAALQYFTGDKHHNVEVRKIAIAKGYKLNEYGLWKGAKLVAAKTEEAVYEKLGLAWMPPELRTASGEIEAAKRAKLPKLIGYGDVRGDLQVQSNWTDGANSIEDMAQEAVALGREYIAITDHSRALAFAHGLDPKHLLAQGKEIDAVNAKLKGKLHILKGIECDILESGKMDLPDSALEKLDIVGGSIHSLFKLPRAEQTKRLIAAMKNPHVDIIFHPTARRIGRREEMDLDMDAIFRTAAATHTVLEVNGSDRMDLRDVWVRRALKFGVKLAIDSDSHSLHGLASVELGTAQARRGWATKLDVINTMTLAELRAWLAKPKAERK
jgi:DNA polymerase (family 10)